MQNGISEMSVQQLKAHVKSQISRARSASTSALLNQAGKSIDDALANNSFGDLKTAWYKYLLAAGYAIDYGIDNSPLMSLQPSLTSHGCAGL
jgi:ribosome-associated toxin RatA of RatAB toxin-antitoxin module